MKASEDGEAESAHDQELEQELESVTGGSDPITVGGGGGSKSQDPIGGGG